MTSNQVIGNVLLGLAAGGLTYTVFAINKTALQTLCQMNYVAAQIVWRLIVPSEWVQPEDTADDDNAQYFKPYSIPHHVGQQAREVYP